MSIQRTISHGLGALTPEAWREIVAAVDMARSSGFMMDGGNALGAGAPRFIDAVITGATQDGAKAKWTYAWTQVRRDASANTWSTESGGLTSTTNGMRAAVNILEGANTESVAYGYAHSGLNLSNHAGYQFKPVPTGTPVHLRLVRDKANVLSVEFSAPNPIDGQCQQNISIVPVQDYDFGEFEAATSTLDLGTFPLSNPQSHDMGAY